MCNWNQLCKRDAIVIIILFAPILLLWFQIMSQSFTDFCFFPSLLVGNSVIDKKVRTGDSISTHFDALGGQSAL